MRIGLFLRVGSLLASALTLVVGALGASPYPQALKYWTPQNIMGVGLAIIEVTTDAVDAQLTAMLAAYHAKALPIITMFVTGDEVKIRCYLPGCSTPSEKVLTLVEFQDTPVTMAKLIKGWLSEVKAPPAPELREVSLAELSGGKAPAPSSGKPAETELSPETVWAKELLQANVDTVRTRIMAVFPEQPTKEELPALQAKLAALQAEEKDSFGDRKGVQVLVTELIQDYATLAAQQAVSEA